MRRPKSIVVFTYVVLGVVAGLKNGELLMAGVVGGHCRDKMADRLPNNVSKVNTNIAVCNRNHHTATGNHMPWDYTVLPDKVL